MRAIARILLLSTSIAICLPAAAQTPAPTSGSPGCAAITQSAVDGATNRINANLNTIPQPTSVLNLTCLNGLFSGGGLNLISNMTNMLFSQLQNRICQVINQEWNQYITPLSHCGIAISGFRNGFNLFGAGQGFMCPRITFGGGGPPMGYLGLGGAGGSGLMYINGQGIPPTGYNLSYTRGLW